MVIFQSRLLVYQRVTQWLDHRMITPTPLVTGSLRAPESGSLRAPWDHLEHQKCGLLRAPENHTFRVTLGDMGLGHGVRHSNLIIFLAVLQTQALHYSFMISYRWGGVGWGGVIMFMFLCTHRYSNLIIFLAVLQTQALHYSFMISYRWGGVGWGNNVHVPVHTQVQQPHHLSCCPADTGTALLFHDQLPVGWGGVITFMFLCTHRYSNLIIFLAVLQTQALRYSFMISYRWGGVGWGNNVHVPVHTQAKRSCYVVTSSSSDLQDVPDML